MKTIYKTKTECHSEYKHSHAWDDFGNYIGRENAIDDKRNYYFDKQKQVKLILKTSSKGNLFWSALPNQTITIQGKVYDFSEIEKAFESYEHRKFKGDIIENGYFSYKDSKVLIQNPEEEARIVGTLFRGDVVGKLHDGTPCIVEVIKSSEISEKKQKHIEENQILTFKIFIDDKGNQITNRDCVIGDREIESINSRIQDGQGRIAEVRSRHGEFHKKGKAEIFKELQRIEYYFEDRAQRLNNEIREIKAQCNAISGEDNSEVERFERRIGYQRKNIEDATNKIEKFESAIREQQGEIDSFERIKPRLEQFNESTLSKISRIELEIRKAKDEFNKVAENCKPEWFGNKSITRNNVNKLNHIKYWTT
jgi:methyl-accepting chemotaxis protein